MLIMVAISFMVKQSSCFLFYSNSALFPSQKIYDVFPCEDISA